MPDISMCHNKFCPSRFTCYRATAKPSRWQSYCTFDNKNNNQCEHYVKDERMFLAQEKPKTNKEILVEAKAWVKGINKYFKINKPIVVKVIKKTSDKYAETVLSSTPYVIYVTPQYFRAGDKLFRVMYHEMVHILLYPLVGFSSIGTKKGKMIESVVNKLERFAQRLAERSNEKD